MGMLRITLQEDPRGVTIKLEGKVVGSWVGEFDRTWRSLESSRGLKKFSLDLRDVSFVDSEGQRLMHEIYEKTGAAFLTNSPLTTYFAEEAMRPTRNNERKGA
jgi:anti-anti-sigma regulatory factor